MIVTVEDVDAVSRIDVPDLFRQLKYLVSCLRLRHGFGWALNTVHARSTRYVPSPAPFSPPESLLNIIRSPSPLAC